MNICLHTNCSNEKRKWLPAIESNSSEIILQPWCILCGLAKNVSDDYGKKIGYWMNITTSICKQHNITQVQKRLITNEILNNDVFIDIYGITGSAQKKKFIKIVKKYCRILAQDINNILY